MISSTGNHLSQPIQISIDTLLLLHFCPHRSIPPSPVIPSQSVSQPCPSPRASAFANSSPALQDPKPALSAWWNFWNPFSSDPQTESSPQPSQSHCSEPQATASTSVPHSPTVCPPSKSFTAPVSASVRSKPYLDLEEWLGWEYPAPRPSTTVQPSSVPAQTWWPWSQPPHVTPPSAPPARIPVHDQTSSPPGVVVSAHPLSPPPPLPHHQPYAARPPQPYAAQPPPPPLPPLPPAPAPKPSKPRVRVSEAGRTVPCLCNTCGPRGWRMSRTKAAQHLKDNGRYEGPPFIPPFAPVPEDDLSDHEPGMKCGP